MKKGFVFMKSYFETMVEGEMTNEEIGVLMMGICNYAFNGIEPTFNDKSLKIYWKLIQPTLDYSLKNYEKNVENGKKGGRPKTQTEPTDNPTITQVKPKHNPTITQVKPTDNPTITQVKPKRNQEKDKDKDKDKEMDMDKEMEMEMEVIFQTPVEVITTKQLLLEDDHSTENLLDEAISYYKELYDKFQLNGKLNSSDENDYKNLYIELKNDGYNVNKYLIKTYFNEK